MFGECVKLEIKATWSREAEAGRTRELDGWKTDGERVCQLSRLKDADGRSGLLFC